jgi:hypothetical protein
LNYNPPLLIIKSPILPAYRQAGEVERDYKDYFMNDEWKWLFLFDDWIPRFFPRLNTPKKRFGVLISHFDVFCCLTGSARFFGSGAVEDDLLVL